MTRVAGQSQFHLIVSSSAMSKASHASERRAIQDWREAIFDEKEQQPTFDELLVFLREQANGRKSNVMEIWMEVLKLPLEKPATSGEASAAVHSFISQAETLGLPTSKFGLVLSSLVLSKLQDTITPEGLHKITVTIAHFYSELAPESQPAAAIIGNLGIFVFLSREIARYFNSKYVPTFMADTPETAASFTEKKVKRVQFTQPRTTAAKKPKESNSDPSIPPSNSSIPERIPVCHGQVLHGNCKYGSKCRYSHDGKLIASMRKGVAEALRQ